MSSLPRSRKGEAIVTGLCDPWPQDNSLNMKHFKSNGGRGRLSPGGGGAAQTAFEMRWVPKSPRRLRLGRSPAQRPCVICVLQLPAAESSDADRSLSALIVLNFLNSITLATWLPVVAWHGATRGQEGAAPRGRFQDPCRQEVGGCSYRVPVKEASHIIYLPKGNSSEGDRGCY